MLDFLTPPQSRLRLASSPCQGAPRWVERALALAPPLRGEAKGGDDAHPGKAMSSDSDAPPSLGYDKTSLCGGAESEGAKVRKKALRGSGRIAGGAAQILFDSAGRCELRRDRSVGYATGCGVLLAPQQARLQLTMGR